MKSQMKWISAMMITFALMAVTACNDDDTDAGKGQAEFEITDAPSDDANIKGVFVTVADIKVDGQSISGFSKQTIDLKAYQKGVTKVLASSDLAAKTYGNITLVLDLDAAADGSSPGCYVLTQDNMKYKLNSASNTAGKLEITSTKDWTVKSNTKSNVVLDFDLRKAISYSTDVAARYRFAASSNLNTAVRLVTKENTGTIKGTYNEQVASNSDKVVVYAYKKAAFNASSEIQAQTDDAITFKNAVMSAPVESSLSGNTYTMAFLEGGDYELYFVAYSKDNLSGRYYFKSLLQSETSVNGSVATSVSVQSGKELSISAIIKGSINN